MKRHMSETDKENVYLGDRVEKVLKKVGADKVARTVERVTKKPCGCQKRKQALNDWHKKQIARAKRARARAHRPDIESD